MHFCTNVSYLAPFLVFCAPGPFQSGLVCVRACQEGTFFLRSLQAGQAHALSCHTSEFTCLLSAGIYGRLATVHSMRRV